MYPCYLDHDLVTFGGLVFTCNSSVVLFYLNGTPVDLQDGKEISPWHDIPLKSGADTFNYVCEIPK